MFFNKLIFTLLRRLASLLILFYLKLNTTLWRVTFQKKVSLFLHFNQLLWDQVFICLILDQIPKLIFKFILKITHFTLAISSSLVCIDVLTAFWTNILYDVQILLLAFFFHYLKKNYQFYRLVFIPLRYFFFK